MIAFRQYEGFLKGESRLVPVGLAPEKVGRLRPSDPTVWLMLLAVLGPCVVGLDVGVAQDEIVGGHQCTTEFPGDCDQHPIRRVFVKSVGKLIAVDGGRVGQWSVLPAEVISCGRQPIMQGLAQNQPGKRNQAGEFQRRYR